jgi:hypothetical protein
VIIVAIIRARSGRFLGFGLQDFLGIGMGRYRDIAEVMGIPRIKLADELTTQLSLPVMVIGLIGLAASVLGRDWRQRWLIAVGAVPMLSIGFLAAFWFPRYLLFTLPPLIVAAVSGWRSLAMRTGRFRQPIQFVILSVCVVFMGYQSALIVFNPEAARWSPVDRFQYFGGWSSGYGYPQAAKFILETPNAPLMI